MHPDVSDKSGMGKVKFLLWLLALYLAGYAAYVVAPPYVSNYMLSIEVDNQANLAHLFKDETMADEILKKADAWSVPITRENITITRGIEDITIEVRYRVDFIFFGSYTKTMDMSIIVHKRLATTDTRLR